MTIEPLLKQINPTGESVAKPVLVSELIMLHIPRKPTQTGFYKQLSGNPLRENPEGSQASGLVVFRNSMKSSGFLSTVLPWAMGTYSSLFTLGRGHLGLQSHPWTSDYARVQANQDPLQTSFS